MKTEIDLIFENVFDQIDKSWEEEIGFLQKLCQFPSTLGNESPIQHFIADFLEKELNLSVSKVIPDPEKLSSHPGYSEPEWTYDERPVVIGEYRAEGDKKGKSVIFQGHIDVVSPEPVSFWEHDPWGAEIVGNKMYGRGTADMKSGVAAMIFALKAVRDAGIKLSSNVIIKTVTEEECTGNGALAAIEEGFKADAALIPEPVLGQKGLIAQVGVIWVRVKVKGLGAHTEKADKAVNSIIESYKMINALLDYEKTLNSQKRHKDFAEHHHPYNINIGKIYSGDWPSTVPSECTIEARVGFPPGVNPQDVKDDIKSYLLAAAEKDEWLSENPPEITFYGFHAEGFSIDPNQELFDVLNLAHMAVEEKPLEVGSFTATTDARFYNLYYDISATCYGPTGEGLHAPNEWVDLDSVKRVTKTYAAFLLKWCGYSNGIITK
ncbi:ArgE/DapE family deacylase [Peribacillus frigoritolerans]|uniref:ArgE/DapE family deacylase n=1 Tax=Peribacillus frigoritolerans TaxID=450367 RepID=A0AAJ1QIW7_9BACI|nr:ArgE/DapE family deacylase [Peribacillus frigoritolerans]MDM5281914.1 ArgE/DapE family deacylase [Peribacillus frigoritolerans]